MASEWTSATLGGLCEFRAGSVFKPALQGQTSGNYPFVKVSDMNLPANAVRIQDANNWVSEQDLKELRARPLPAGTVVFAKIGEALRQNRLRQVARETVIDNNMMGAVPRTASVEPRFFYYALSKFDFSDIAQGTALPYLTVSALSALTLDLPTLREQRAIAHILGTLDDKIELNRRMNETLEAMAGALFKSWFVDFDPVRAKAEGRNPGLPRPLADLFPDFFEDSELGKIPEGWGISTVGEEFNLTMGQSPPGETYNRIGKGMPFFQGRADFGFRFPSHRVFCTAPSRFADPGDTLVSVRAPVGDINMALERCSVGRGVAAIRHKSGSRSYTYCAMLSLGDVFGDFEAEGTVFGCINKDDFHRIKFIAPPPQLVLNFEKAAFPIDQTIENNTKQSCTLAALRDVLLPKLISGGLRIKGAEKMDMEDMA